jgi:Putative Actinobacterial Holin-X, holin superfamily III
VSTGTDPQTDPQTDPKIGETINEITERATLIIREELELARTEVEVKVKNLVRGAAIAGAAGFFVLMGMILFLEGLAWIFYINVFVDPFWGFLIVAGGLFLLGGLAGWLAARLFKKGAPPTPDMAIDEAKLIKESVEDSAKGPQV